jgi:hypothetical protein
MKDWEEDRAKGVFTFCSPGTRYLTAGYPQRKWIVDILEDLGPQLGWKVGQGSASHL